MRFRPKARTLTRTCGVVSSAERVGVGTCSIRRALEGPLPFSMVTARITDGTVMADDVLYILNRPERVAAARNMAAKDESPVFY